MCGDTLVALFMPNVILYTHRKYISQIFQLQKKATIFFCYFVAYLCNVRILGEPLKWVRNEMKFNWVTISITLTVFMQISADNDNEQCCYESSQCDVLTVTKKIKHSHFNILISYGRHNLINHFHRENCLFIPLSTLCSF